MGKEALSHEIVLQDVRKKSWNAMAELARRKAEGLTMGCRSTPCGSQVGNAANDFLKPQQIKCTTVAIRHRIRTSLRSEAMGPIDVFERAETIEFCSLYLSIYFEILDPPESTR
ncbi:hypothetical protein DYB34_000886 [Aphanomyces astaci]|uniref:Uncharacterized protein n=1 Tax=Aphanomyces astaci TaxID=112090 RepID=A0A418BC34_APHAT|nr:hypothetical protein DYB34_000886 [Aphanomyces astaci]